MSDEKLNHDSMIKEYEKTQDMIKHYDDITIRFSALSQSGVLIFIGLSFGILTKDTKLFLYLFPVVILFVIMINTLIHMWFKRHRSISQIKIHRILSLEKELGWKQFTLVDEAIKANKVASKPARVMVSIYHIGLPVILIISYFFIIIFL